MTNAELEKRPLLTLLREKLLFLARREAEKIEFTPVSDESQERLEELMICDLCAADEFHVWHRKWGKERRRWLEWEDEGQSLYFTVFQEHHFEVWGWQFRPDEQQIGLKFLFLSSLPFELSVGAIISERQPTQLFQKMTSEGPEIPKMHLSLEIPSEDPGDRYWGKFFQKENQEIILSRLLEGFS